MNLNATLLLVSITLTLHSCASAKTSTPNQNPDATQALADLKSGNSRFSTGKVRTDGQSKSDIERLSTGQSPRAIVLSCSDSRLPPETVFDQKLGEIFTVRTAGEALSPTALGSIEFAIEKLGARLIVVMGHTSCGAVKAAIDTLNGQDAGSENLNRLVGDIHPRIRGKFKPEHPSKGLKDESWLNVKGVAADLSNRSGIIRKAITTGKVFIQTAIYNLDSGSVEFE